MNSLIENLNQLGGQFLSFAWPMLWQSSLLIAALFAIDLLFRRKLRASVRYALWLVVLVKLCVPPTLALPTSPAWWVHKTPPPVIAKSLPHYTVTYDNGPLPEIPQVPLTAFVPPKPALTNAAWLLVASVAVSSALLCWLLVRWWQITRLVRRATSSERLTFISDGAQKITGMKLKVQVKLATNSMSPAVCGLFRPAILIPQSLAENFSDEQLRAVLLHELIHLRRRDVWVNFLQALLQIVYWWHPLVWLANVRIRRVREEAVDDAVMLALRDEAEAYAPTLLEVAKLALNRPLVSLGLVGIIESRSALRQRIERLVDFHPPRQAGLTLASVLGIMAFTAVAVPMGDGPNSSDKNNLPATPALVTSLSSTPTNAPVILIQGEIYRMRQTDFEKLISDPAFVNTRNDEVKNFQQFERLVKSTGFSPIARPRIQTSSGMPAHFYVGNETNSIEFESLPLVTNGLIKLANHIKMISMVASVTTTNDTDTQTTLQNGGGQIFSIRPPYVPGESNLIVVTVSAEIVTNRAPQFQQRLQSIIKREPADAARQSETFVQDAKLLYEMGKLDEAEVKLKAALVLDTNNAAAKYNFELVQSARSSSKWGVFKPERQNIAKKLDRIRIPSVSIDHLNLGEVVRQLSEASRENDPDKLGIKISTVTNSVSRELVGINSVVIDLPSPLKDVLLADVLDAVLLVASEPIKYSILDDGVVFSLRDGAGTKSFYSRHFRMDPNIFTTAMLYASGIKSNSVTIMARDFFKTLGVDLDVPGKSIFFNDRLGELFVRATATDLDAIENALEVLNRIQPQIHIKARFLEMPKGTLDGLKNVISITNQIVQSNQVAGLFGILTDKNFRTVLHKLETLPDVETLGEPEVVTISGRQTQMRATRLTTKEDVVFDVVVSRPVKSLEFGPVLDVVPYVLSDGYTINLTLNPSLMEPLVSSNSVPKNLPNFRVRQVVTTLNLWDNQTAIITGLPEKDYVGGKEVFDKTKASDKELLVFITATIVDRAGNRVHAEGE